MDNETEILQRIDRWLNYSCLFKTRAKATKACDDRRIKVNGEVAKPAKMVKAGDIITIKNPKGKYFNFKIIALSEKNISAKDAKSLYEKEELELTEEAKELLEIYSQSIKIHKPKYKGRPTKKERRKIDKFKKESSFNLKSKKQFGYLC